VDLYYSRLTVRDGAVVVVSDLCANYFELAASEGASKKPHLVTISDRSLVVGEASSSGGVVGSHLNARALPRANKAKLTNGGIARGHIDVRGGWRLSSCLERGRGHNKEADVAYHIDSIRRQGLRSDCKHQAIRTIAIVQENSMDVSS
jgi:hypothetical protein